MACVCALGIAVPQPVFGVLCQMTHCVWFMSSGKVAFLARVDVRMVNGEILNLLTYNEWWLMFCYRSCSLFRCLSVGVIYCMQQENDMYVLKCTLYECWLFLDMFLVRLCDDSTGQRHTVTWTHGHTYKSTHKHTASACIILHTKWTFLLYGASTLHSQWGNV